jgi:hypothetical protein
MPPTLLPRTSDRARRSLCPGSKLLLRDSYQTYLVFHPPPLEPLPWGIEKGRTTRATAHHSSKRIVVGTPRGVVGEWVHLGPHVVFSRIRLVVTSRLLTKWIGTSGNPAHAKFVEPRFWAAR